MYVVVVVVVVVEPDGPDSENACYRCTVICVDWTV